MMLLIRTFLIIFALHTLATQAELSTIERIKKHQEWLRQRGLLRPQISRKTSLFDERWKIKEPTKPLWQRVNNNNNNNKADDPRKNDVYPENETTTISATTLSSTSNTSGLHNNIPTEPTITPFPVTSTTTTTTPRTSTTQKTTSTTTTSTTTEQPTTTSLITTTTIELTTPSTTNIPLPPTQTTTTAKTISEESPTTTSTTTTTTTLRPKPKLKLYPRWSTWSNWSACSRTCGGGVMSQQRKCISKRQATGKRYISNDCMGIYRRYHLCNEQACPSANDDFRQQQCSAFDDVDFQGRKYVWEPYIKDDAECELNCKPMGMKYFATLNNSVIDGTACFRPAEYYRSNYRGRAICVGGICKVS